MYCHLGPYFRNPKSFSVTNEGSVIPVLLGSILIIKKSATFWN